jgi:PAS domain-containing protein
MSQQQRGQRQQPDGEPTHINQLQATLNVVPAHTWYTTSSGGLTFVNKRIADYLGLPNDHPLRFGIDIGAPWDAHIPLLHPDDHEEARKVWSTCLRTGEAGGVSFRVRSAEGDYRWFLSRAEPLRASDGTLLLWVGVNLDIEEFKNTEKALRESEARFRDYAAIGDADWYWETDPDHKFARVTDNGRLLARRGFALASRIGLARWEVATDIESEPEKWELHRSMLEARQPFRDFVYRAKRSNGSLAVFKVSGNPMHDAKGAFLGYRGTGTDLTAAVRAQEEHERLLRWNQISRTS